MKKAILIHFVIGCMLASSLLSGTMSNPSQKKVVTPSNNELGSISNPIKCDGAHGEIEYLQRLKDSSGNPVKFSRIKHVNPGPDCHILDLYEIESKDGTIFAEICMDMYWTGYIESRAIQEFEIKKPKNQQNVIYQFESTPLTAQDVYQMIVDNGFYCEIISGTPMHDEGLLNIQKPVDDIFPLRRTLWVETSGNGNIETWSRADFTPPAGSHSSIRLFWLPTIEDCTFKNAISIVDIHNCTQKGGFSEWRIPTVTELFSIINNAKNPFPKEMNIQAGESVSFWTATPVKKKGTVLEPEKWQKAYYIITCKYIKKDNAYKIGFDFLNPDDKNAGNAFLLPVFSEKRYSYQPHLTTGSIAQKGKPNNSNTSHTTPIQTPSITPITTPIPKNSPGNDKVPGFDYIPNTSTKKSNLTPPSKSSSGDSIPGFDDITTPNQFSSQANANSPRTVKIVLYPFHTAGEADTTITELNDLNSQIQKELNGLSSTLKKNKNLSLVIEKKDSTAPNDLNEIIQFYPVMSDQKTSDDEKLNRLKSQIMNSQKIDLIITVTIKNDATIGVQYLQPTIISGVDDRIHETLNIQKNQTSSLAIQDLKDRVMSILKNHF